MSVSENDQLNAEFLAESEEILGRVFHNVALFEKGPLAHEKIDELYRDVHTLKGSAFLFGFNEIGGVAHTLEACLDPIRREQIFPTARLLDSFFDCLGLIESLLREIGENDGSAKALVIPKVSRLIENACQLFGSNLQVSREVLTAKFEIDSTVPRTVEIKKSSDRRLNQDMEENVNSNQDLKDIESKAGSDASAVDSTSDTTIRVQVALLDKLMNLIGEMVLVRNQVLQYSSRSEDLGFLNLSQRLDLVTSDLQDQVMRTRMQPIGNVIGKFQRMIRDLAKSLGKNIDLTIQGKDTELDKTLLEAIKDPLTHIVRNSCDHGIEFPDERKTAGKPTTGHILVSAFHEGGQVIIEISDDGKGLSRQRILQKAIERGLVTSEKSGTLEDREILSLIFLAGFSTAEKVSSVSGRGVGMDVVRTNIEKIGGSVDLESVEGKGTTIRLRIPLTLAIVPAMLVKSRSATYAIPQVKLVELVRVDNSDPENPKNKIHLLQGKPVYELRGRILPLVDLRQVLSVPEATEKILSPLEMQTANVVVLSAEGILFGLIVDEVLDTADIVVKPLSKFLKSLELYSAATILGTGNVALILDPIGVAKAAQLSTVSSKQEGHFSDMRDSKAIKNTDTQEFLLFKTNAQGIYAMPLCMVSRLEEINREQLEYSGKQPVVQYRESIMPLVDVNEVLGFSDVTRPLDMQIPTVVVHRSGKAIGLAVNAIHDVMTSNSVIDDSIKDRFGILGNLISGEDVITVIDVLGIVESEMRRFVGSKSGSVEVEEKKDQIVSIHKKIKVLYAEDVAFFRRQVTKLLSTHGFDVVTAVDGKAALEILNAPDAPEFSLILSDIEMPNMNGYQLAEAIRQIPRYKKTPMAALTTRFSQRDIEQGLQSGFNAYMEKLNPEVLMEKLSGLLNKKTDAA